MKIEDLERIYNSVRSAEKPIIIAVSGGSASGKTSQVSTKLKNYFLDLGLTSQVLSQDNFQLGKTFVNQFNNKYPNTDKEQILCKKLEKYKWDTPENFDLDFCFETLRQIKGGIKEVLIPQFNLKEAQREGETNFYVPEVIIFEGIYSFFGSLSKFPFDYKIFVDSNFSDRILKRYFRFIYEHNNSKKETAIKHIFITVFNANCDFVELQKPAANLILKSEYCFRDTIKKFGLKPIIIENGLNLEIEIEIVFENIGYIRFARLSDKHIFIVVYGDEYYEYLEVDKLLYEQIVANLQNLHLTI